MSSEVLNWLLEDKDPAVKYRTLTELLDIDRSSNKVASAYDRLVSSDIVKAAFSYFDIGKEYADAYAFAALSEYGLTREDINIDSHVKNYISRYGFANGCGEGFLLRNLVKLGYFDMPEVKYELSMVLPTEQADGGYPCVSKNPKINKPNVSHKSCFQMSTSYLLLMAELHRIGHDSAEESGLVDYFLNRNVLYRHDNPSQVVKAEMGTTFHPPVATRIGLHMILYSLSLLGKANDLRCTLAWEMLETRRCDDGKYIIDGSLTKPYIKIERPGMPSKWVTFYAMLTKKHQRKYVP